ncbi:MAG: tRNA pseudouridine synthase [Pseudomonadota bacterium]
MNGILVLDKPVGPSSTQALSAARRLFGAAKAGHGGTLDPMASGVLPVLFGEATKFAQQGLDADKTYQAQIRLGQETTTGDAEGEVVATAAVDVSVDEIDQVLLAQLGLQMQTPPMFSALKHQGRPLYEYARAGQTVDKPARQIQIFRVTRLAFASPDLTIEVHCSKGTYIRVLAQTIGRSLGCGAHLAGLRRTAVAGLLIGQSVSLKDLDQMAPQDRPQCLLPVDALAADWPRVDLTAAQATDLGFGRSLDWVGSMAACDDSSGCHLAAKLRLYDHHQRFLGIGQVTDGRLIPLRLVAQSILH